MEPEDLNETQKRILSWLEKAGAASPSRLSAETRTPPAEAWGMLYQLAEWGYVIMREDPDSADGTLVLAAPMGKWAKK